MITQIAIVILPPFSGGNIASFANHLRRTVSAPVYIQADAIEYVGPTRIERLAADSISVKSDLFRTFILEKRPLPPVPVDLNAPIRPPSKPPGKRFILVVEPQILAKEIAFPNQITVSVSLNAQPEKKPEDDIALSKNGDLVSATGTVTLKNLNNLGLSKKIEIPYYFQSMRVCILDQLVNESDFIKHVAKAVGCVVQESGGAIYFAPRPLEIRTRLLNTIRFHDTNDGSFSSRARQLRADILSEMPEGILAKGLTNEVVIEDSELQLSKRLKEKCQAYVRETLRGNRESNNQENQLLADTSDYPVVGVKMAPYLTTMFYAIDKNGKALFLPF